MAKTNIEYLREKIEDDTEAVEFLDAVISDHSIEIDNLQAEVIEKEERITQLEKYNDNLDVFYETIDFGVGQLKYIQPDNLLVHNFMDGLKERFHGHALH